MQISECYSLFKSVFPFWESLDNNDKSLLCENCMSDKYSSGQNVHGTDGKCTGAIVVKNGSLRIYMLSEDGREITLYRLYSGDVCMLSASCVMESITFDVFVDAQEDCDCLIINPSVLSDISKRNVLVENYILQTTSERFSEVMWTMQQILFMSFDKRLAVFLIDELAKSGGDTVQLTQEQIAKYVGSAREVVSRMLKYFSSEKLVEVSRGGVKVIDKKGLMNLIR